MTGFAQVRLDEFCPIAAGRAAVQREADEMTVFEPPGFTLNVLDYAMRVLR